MKNIKERWVIIKKNNFTLRQLILIALFVSVSMISKRYISPVTNLLTDIIRVPGGSLATGFSIMFLVVGKRMISNKTTATLMAVSQGLFAIAMGSMMNILTLVAYVFPGILIDIIYNHKHKWVRFITDRTLAQVACALGVVCGAAINNFLVFQLPLIAMILFYMLGILSGIVGGTLADLVYNRINKGYLKLEQHEKENGETYEEKNCH